MSAFEAWVTERFPKWKTWRSNNRVGYEGKGGALNQMRQAFNAGLTRAAEICRAEPTRTTGEECARAIENERDGRGT